MKQRYQLINLTAQQVTEPFRFSTWPTSRIVELISVRQPRELDDVSVDFPVLRPAREAGTGDLGILAQVPAELLEITLENLDTESLIMLCIANSQLFRLGYPLLCKRILEFLSPWQECRLICLGERGCGSLPNGCVPELDSFDDIESASPSESESLRLYKLARKTFTPVKKQFVPSSSPPSSRMLLATDHEDDLHRFLLLAYDYRQLLKPLSEHVLVNLTKKQYIPSASRTLQSLVMCTLQGYPSHRGPWAGDQLVILPKDTFTSELGEDEGPWTDFTKEGKSLRSQLEPWGKYY
ncbi:hypothetical protein ONZ45_g14233 [Pleurotus djamor]|nr:hypothetical protein ONZ45_g14233 [Pleurotus djamor]